MPCPGHPGNPYEHLMLASGPRGAGEIAAKEWRSRAE